MRRIWTLMAVTAAVSLKVLLGEEPMPDRGEVDAWMAQSDAVHDGIYGPP